MKIDFIPYVDQTCEFSALGTYPSFGQSQCVMNMASHARNTLEAAQESKTRNDKTSAERPEVEFKGIAFEARKK